jgi:hypothetical protein
MIALEMALSGELVQRIEQKNLMGDSGSGSSFSLNRSVLGEINLSEVLEQSRHTALSYVKHTEKLRFDGALLLACGGDPSSSLNENSASMNSEVDIVADSPRTQMLVAKISKKKKKKKAEVGNGGGGGGEGDGGGVGNGGGTDGGGSGGGEAEGVVVGGCA